MKNTLPFSAQPLPRLLIDYLSRTENEIVDLPNLPALPERPEVSIIIPIHNQLKYTIQCLHSIANTTTHKTYEVVVVDDASELSVFSKLATIPNIRLLRNFSNLGFVHSCNRGGRCARGRFIVLLNNDTEVTQGWLDALVETFESRPDAGLVGAKLLYPDGTLQEAGGICWRDGSAWNYGRNQDSSRPEFNYLRETDYCSGACIMLPIDLWQELLGFDDLFAPAYYEDTDLAFRVRAAGRRVYFQPEAAVIHHEGKSNGIDESSGIKRYQVCNRERFLKRWEYTLAEHHPNSVDVFRARERSFTRKTILFVDHYVPHPDRDAGSRSIMSYLRFFVEEGFSVKFVGDNFAEPQPYTKHLQQMGIEVFYGNHHFLNWEAWLQEVGPSIDYVFLSRAPTSRRWIAPLRKSTTAPLLFYGHDLLSRTLMRAFERFGDTQHKLIADHYNSCEQEVFPSVDWIFYPSQEEVDLLRSRYPQMRIARLPLLTVEPPDGPTPSFENRRGLIFVGGFGHPPNIDALTWFVEAVWPELLAMNLTLTIVGSNPPAEILALQSPEITIRSNVPDPELAELYRSHRVAIVPLRIGGGIKGKVLESMRFGTPVVTTKIGSEGLTWTGEHLAQATETAFAQEVISVYHNSARWTLLQTEASRFLAAEYSTERLRSALALAIPELSRTLIYQHRVTPQIPKRSPYQTSELLQKLAGDSVQ